MNEKNLGQVFTPQQIVCDMLDLVGYSTNSDLSSLKIIDNSCGNGAFLEEVVIRIIKKYSLEAKKIIEQNVFGIELDEKAYNDCIYKLNEVCKSYNIIDVNWNIVNENTLHIFETYKNQFDIVIGNPPYVRIHNTSENLKQFNFCNNGMTDLYIAFYEVGISMLNETGKLCYINPSSIFNSKASKTLRKFLIVNNLISKVIDFKHKQLFDKITTYSCILLLDKNNNNQVIDFSNSFQKFIKLKYKEFYFNDNFYFSLDKNKLLLLKDIFSNTIRSNVEVKNGAATLCDDFFIKDEFDFNSNQIIDILKASTSKQKKCLFPYNFNNIKPMDLDEFDVETKEYFLENETILKRRSCDDKEKWWLFGRSQSINDFNKKKISINTTIKDLSSLKINNVNTKTLVYSGLYMININNNIVNIIKNQNFIDYISLLSKYKAGGYYTFSSKDLKMYIDYYLTIS